MAIEIQSGERIIFIGDSITDAQRREEFAPLGCGYVKLFADMLTVREPTRRVTVFNRGINGDRVSAGLAHIPKSGLANRWTSDVLELKPDWLSIKIGINDVHTHIKDDVPSVLPEAYERDYDRLLTLTREALPQCRLLLIQPFYMTRGTPPDPVHQRIAALLPPFLDAVERLSVKHETRLIRTHALFQAVIAEQGTEVFGRERVHPNATGHLLIADAVWSALGG